VCNGSPIYRATSRDHKNLVVEFMKVPVHVSAGVFKKRKVGHGG
jgi:hypothetical protein